VIANLLTTIRLLLVVPATLAFARSEFMSPLLLATVLTVAIATDYFDGIVARSRNTASPRGQLFDHTTDFLSVTCGLGGAALAGQVTPALPCLIVVAFSQYVLDSHFFYREKRLRMSFLGRWNGILYFVPLVMIGLSRLGMFEGENGMLTTPILLVSYVLLLSTAASIVDRAIAPLRGPRRSPA